VHVDAAVQPYGSVRVEQRYRFASDDGGTVALPAALVNPALTPEAQLAVGGIRNLGAVLGEAAARPLTP
jgi:hypothetical protein